MTATAQAAPIAPEPAANAASWPETSVTLTHPITGADGTEIRVLTFREPDVEALEKIETVDAAEGEQIKVRHLRAIAAALSRQPDEVIRRINARDFARIAEAIAPFLQGAAAAPQSSGS
jgi:hypothetical protein